MTPTKSLTEVTQAIAQMALSGTAPYDPFTLLMDAHHYLVEYYLENTEKNPPLAWCELQKMVGKPVWIECYPEGHKSSARWYVIREIGSKDRENLMYCHGAFHFTKDAQGKIWNAYLKERTNANEA